MFRKDVFIRNIYGLAEKKNLKIGEIEKECGVSTGFFSRYKKEDGNARISIDSASAISEILGVSLETMISYDMTRMSQQEIYQNNFFSKLLKDTETDVVRWHCTPLPDVEEMCELGHGYYDIYEIDPLPIILWDEDGYPHYYGVAQDANEKMNFHGDVYACRINKGMYVYLVDVEYCSEKAKVIAIDFWGQVLGNKQTMIPLFTTKTMARREAEKAETLKKAIETSLTRDCPNENVKAFIDLYLGK